jgi:hypothetical protein
MDVKRYDLMEDRHTMCSCKRVEDSEGDYVLYDDIKHLLTRPDPAEVERLIVDIINWAGDVATLSTESSKYYQAIDELDKARADLLKLVGGDPDNDPIAKRVHDTFEKISHTNWGQLK